MKHPTRRTLLAAAAPLLMPAWAMAQASAWPTRAVKLQLPAGPGGGSDSVMQLLSRKLEGIWKQPVVIEYKPGANSVVATDYVARSVPDGTTLGVALTAYFINPALPTHLPFDTLRDLCGLSVIATSDFGMFAYPGLAINSVAELIEHAKRHPGKLTYGTGGVGSGSHLAWELFSSMAGISLVHVPYSKGGGAAQADVMTGRVDLLMDVAFGQMPAVDAGRLKVIALAGPKRSAVYPRIPLIAETVPGFSALSTMGIFGPAKLPKDLQKRISDDIVAVVRDPEMRARMLEMGLEPVGSSGEEFNETARREIEKWTRVIRTSGIKLN